MLEDAVLQKIMDIVYDKIYNEVDMDDELAKELTAQTMSELLKRLGNINPNATINYAKQIANSKCIDHFRKKKKEAKAYEQYSIQTFANTSQNSTNIKQETKQDDEKILKKVMRKLPKEDKIMFDKYRKSGNNLQFMAEEYNARYTAVKQKLYDIKDFIQTEFLIEKGMEASRKMITRQRHKKFIKFIKTIDECIKINDMKGLARYCRKDAKDISIPPIHMKKFIKYNIKRITGDKFMIYVVYLNTSAEVDSYRMVILIPRKGVPITIVEFPQAATKIVSIDTKDISREHRDKCTKKDVVKGLVNVSREDIEKIISKYAKDRKEPKE